MALSNSHEMSYRQALTPDALQARTNTTMRSLNRAVVVVVSPLAGLAADRVGYGWSLGFAAAVFALSGLLLLLSPFRGHAPADAGGRARRNGLGRPRPRVA